MLVALRLHKMLRESTWLPGEGLNIQADRKPWVWHSYPVDSRTKEGLLHLADEAMYLAKNTNRDSGRGGQRGESWSRSRRRARSRRGECGR